MSLRSDNAGPSDLKDFSVERDSIICTCDNNNSCIYSPAFPDDLFDIFPYNTGETCCFKDDSRSHPAGNIEYCLCHINLHGIKCMGSSHR